jgi:hypothetical protein
MHMPLEQAVPAAQTLPHAPQLPLSVLVLAQNAAAPAPHAV